MSYMVSVCIYAQENLNGRSAYRKYFQVYPNRRQPNINYLKIFMTDWVKLVPSTQNEIFWGVRKASVQNKKKRFLFALQIITK